MMHWRIGALGACGEMLARGWLNGTDVTHKVTCERCIEQMKEILDGKAGAK